MFTITKQLSPHGARLERWLGRECVDRLSAKMVNWYGPPIAVSGVPGNLWVHRGGDFGGIIKSGQFINAVDWALGEVRKMAQRAGHASRRDMNMGFATLSALQLSARNGGLKTFKFSKIQTNTPTPLNSAISFWPCNADPIAGSAASAAPGGRAPTSATDGGFPFSNPPAGQTQHFVSSVVSSSMNESFLVYDRIFDVLKDGSIITSESVTGVPTRYQSSTATDADYAGGNFAFLENFAAGTGSAGRTWDGTYRNQAGTDSQVFTSMVAPNANPAVNRLENPVTSSWFWPLASGDTGVKDFASLQISSTVTGSINGVIGHPLAWIPCPAADFVCRTNNINTSFNLVRIFDDACLAMLGGPTLLNGSALPFNGYFTTVSG